MSGEFMKTGVQVAVSSVVGLAVLGLLLFVPAGTLNYWQAWVFIAVFTTATVAPAVYLGRNNPEALQRRMHSGPQAEARPIQKLIITVAFFALFATTAFSALDHRMGWSSAPAPVCVLGDLLVAAGLGLAMLVVVQNAYAAATVTVES